MISGDSTATAPWLAEAGMARHATAASTRGKEIRRHLPLSLARLRALLHANSRIESRIVILQWVVMLLVGIGALLPHGYGAGLGRVQATMVALILVTHPLAYISAAHFGYDWLVRRPEARMAILTALDVSVAVGVLFLTATSNNYNQVLLFSVVLIVATRYSLGRAIGVTTLMSILQFFSIIAANRHGLAITNLSSAVVAMFALTYGVNLLSQAERKEAAIANENARLYRAVLLRNRELATINALSQTATVDTNPDRLLESGLELILTTIPVSWGQAFRYDRATGEVELLFVRQPAMMDGDSPAARQEALQAARSRTVVTDHRGTDREAGIRVSAPILVQGYPVGVLQTLAPDDDTESEGTPPTQSMTIVCQELGTWVERALLRDAAQRGIVFEEKNRIARELHDTVLQILFSSALGVEWCMQRAADNPALLAKLAEIRRLTAQASGELRGAIFTLSSRVAEVGLLPAMESLVSTFTEQHKLPVSFSTVGQPPELSVLSQNAMHRVVRESLMNAYKHAQASLVAVRVVFEPSSVSVIVQDDGVGLPPYVVERFTEDSAHFGLRTIAKQVEEVGGRFEIMNGEEGGTIVRATVPVKPGSEEVFNDRYRAD